MTEGRIPPPEADRPEADVPAPTRRTLLRGAALASLAAAGGALSACAGTRADAAPAVPAGPTDNPDPPVRHPRGKGEVYHRGPGDVAEDHPVGTDAASGTVLGPTSAVPVGGGTIYEKQKIVVTQPTKGEWHAFSAVCTHQDCLLADCEGGVINCGCHVSSFSLTDGSPLQGPATVALPKVKIKVAKGKITRA